MESSDTAITNWWGRFKASLLADKRKAALLFALSIAGAVTLIGLLTSGKLPAKVKAGTPAGEKAGVATPSPLRPHPGVSEAYLAGLDTEVTRDLFAIEYSAFPPTDPGHIGRPDPVPTVPDPNPGTKRQRHVAQIKQQARALKLQSAMPGNPPTAIINGYVISAGDVLSGFTVRRIETGRCVLIKEGVTVTLEME